MGGRTGIFKQQLLRTLVKQLIQEAVISHPFDLLYHWSFRNKRKLPTKESRFWQLATFQYLPRTVGMGRAPTALATRVKA